MRRVPTTPWTGADLVPMFTRHLEMCRVTDRETVLGFTDTQSNPAYGAALMAAARLLGAEYLQMTVAADDEWMKSRVIVDAWKGCDLMAAMISTPWLYSRAHNDALDAGTRTLMIEEPEDILARLFPTEVIRRRCEAGEGILKGALELRIASEAGTDLTLSMEGRPPVIQWGVSDQPGRWDHWPSGLVAVAPLETSAEGVLVIDRGDALLNPGCYVRSPITCRLREGRIVSIEGGADANLMSGWFERARDDRAYAVSHIGWGCDDRADWNALGLRAWEGGGAMDVESYHGGMLIAFGSNCDRGLAGRNTVDFHFDIPTRNHDFFVDGRQVIDRGVFTVPGLAAAHTSGERA